jgi:hypothetical protein
MNTIERIEARKTITCHRSGVIDELNVMLVNLDEWAAIKAVVEAAAEVLACVTVYEENEAERLRELSAALSKMEN